MVSSSSSSSISAATAAVAIPHGTPFVTTTTPTNSAVSFSVVSYNLLADAYVRPIDQRTGTIQPFAAFDWLPPDGTAEAYELLDLEHRRGPRLLASLQQSQADVICLQELQLETIATMAQEEEPPSTTTYAYRLPAWLAPMTARYSPQLPPLAALEKIAARNERVLDRRVAIVCGILIKQGFQYRTRQHEDTNTCVSVCLRLPHERYHDDAEEEKTPHPTNNNTDNDDDAKPTRTFTDVAGIGAAAAVTNEVVVTCIHLDAKDELKRVKQLTGCLQRAKHFAFEHNANDDEDFSQSISTIIVGDLNTELWPGSCCRAFLTTASDAAATDDATNPKTTEDNTACSPNQNNNEHQNRTTATATATATATLINIDKDNDTNTNSPNYKADHNAAMVRECAAALRLPNGVVPTDTQLQDWTNCYTAVREKMRDEFCLHLDRVPTGPTRSAWDHDAVETTTSTSSSTRTMAQWRLDHFLYTTDTLQLRQYWSTLEADPVACQTGLPNHGWGSDHLAIGAIFHVTTRRMLSKDQASQFLLELENLVKRQRRELLEREAELNNELELLKVNLGSKSSNSSGGKSNSTDEQDQSSAPPNNSGTIIRNDTKERNKKKRKSRNTGPPPTEVIELIRRKRSVLRSMKEHHTQERAATVKDLDNPRRLLILQRFQCASITEWIHREEGG